MRENSSVRSTKQRPGIYVTVDGFPMYECNSRGEFFRKKTGNQIKVLYHKRMPQVTLYDYQGKRHTLNARKLVQKSFGEDVF